MKLHDAATLDLPELVEELVSRTAAQMYEAISGDEMTVAEAEERVVELCRALGRELLSVGLSERYGRQQGPRRPCACGAHQRFEGYRTRTIMTLLGPIEYERAYYRCPVCRTSRYLGEDTIGVDEYGCSLPAQEAMALVGCELPFRCARDLLMRLTGLDVSTSVVRRVTEEHGARVERAAVREREALFAGELELLPEGAPQRLYVTLDGLQMPFVGDWHETKIGAVYEARVGEDGAVWIWHLVAEHFPGAVQILDFFHAAERLHEVGRAVYGEGASPARQWAEANKERLWQGRVDSVLRSLRAVRAPTAEGREAVRLAVGYFETNRQRMDYPSYRARGYHVGSGVVEAACKTVAAARCKRSGMRWTKHGAQAVLNLRCLQLNARWDQYWKPLKTAA